MSVVSSGCLNLSNVIGFFRILLSSLVNSSRRVVFNWLKKTPPLVYKHVEMINNPIQRFIQFAAVFFSPKISL